MLFALAVHSPIPSLVLHHISVDCDWNHKQVCFCNPACLWVREHSHLLIRVPLNLSLFESQVHNYNCDISLTYEF